MFYLFILFYASLILSSCTARHRGFGLDSQEQSLSESTGSTSNNRAILERRLANNQKASVGVLICYTNDKKENFILLGREQVGKCDGATWCELGGSVETNESFLEAAIRESKEESGGTYQLEANDLLNNRVVFYNENQQKDGRIREEVYILLKVNDYYPANALRSVVRQQNEDSYREKDDFKWISCARLAKVEDNPCLLNDIDGNQSTITLRKFFYEALKRDPLRMQLLSMS